MIFVVGLSHKSAPLALRERLGGGAEVQNQVLGSLAEQTELTEAVFLSTCNRVEVLLRPPDESPAAAAAAVTAVKNVLASMAPDSGDLSPHLYQRDGREAVRHMFRVAASLDSMVLGEPQILGQVKGAYDLAVNTGTLHGPLERSLTHAFAVAKRVRSETRIGEGSVSISSVAVELAERVFGELSESTVLLVGAGEMGEAALRALGKAARQIRVCNRSIERAARLAAQVGGSAAPLENLEEELVTADVVITSTSSSRYVITRDMVQRVAKRRRGRMLLFVDIAVPRNVDPAIHGSHNAFVFNVDDLEAQVAESLEARGGERARAEAIVEEELAKWDEWARSLQVKPMLVALRERTRRVLDAELERALAGKLKHLGAEERRVLAQVMESATNKLLHAPTQRLKAAEEGEGAERIRVLAELFELGEPSGVTRAARPVSVDDAAAAPLEPSARRL